MPLKGSTNMEEVPLTSFPEKEVLVARVEQKTD